MSPDEEAEVEIQALAGADGLAKIEGLVIFVPFSAPGDRLRVRIREKKKDYARAEIVEVLRPGPDRASPFCPAFGECGGCDWQHLALEAQIRWKARLLQESLQRIGKISWPQVEVIPSPQDRGYRKKSAVAFRPRGAGFFRRRSHEVVPVDACPVQAEGLNRLLRAVKELGLPPYDEESGEGLLRHLVGRENRKGQVLACLVVTRLPLPAEISWGERLAREVPGLVGVAVNLNPYRTNVILGEKTLTVWGESYIFEELDGLSFRISPPAFFQVNPDQAEALYRLAASWACPRGGEMVVDAYAGTGSLTLFLARRAGKAVGIEEVAEAVEDARANATLNGIKNVFFHRGQVEELLPHFRAETVVLDPPRQGLTPRALAALLQVSPPRVVYVSCSPATLARDLRYLTESGYRLRNLAAFDFFPHTAHVEAVALLERERKRLSTRAS